MTSILIAGATGLVGSEVLRLALGDVRIEKIIAPTRRPLAANTKLHNPIVDFDRLPLEADWWAVDGAICALGTTRAKAGSVTANRAVDFGYPLTLARSVREGGALKLAVVSSMGANANSRFLYTRTKGELEDALNLLQFKSLTLVRPGLIGGHREEFRAAERLAGVILRAFGPLLPPLYRISPAVAIARVLVNAAIAGLPGKHVIKADQLVE
jgi:uncharacterized protein YbjT (DUF2867 family)